MKKSIFHVALMDCPSEEQIIDLRLQSFGEIKSMAFDIPDRKLEVYHSGETDLVLAAMLVNLLQSAYPDLVIDAIVFTIVAEGHSGSFV